MKTLTGLHHTKSYIALTWGKDPKSRKWRELIQRNHKAELGNFLRFSSAKLNGKQYLFHIYERAAFLIEETSSTTGRVTHFGYGPFKGTKALRWKLDSYGCSAKGGFRLLQLDMEGLGKINSVKQLLKDFPAHYEGEDLLDKLYKTPKDLMQGIYHDSAVLDAVTGKMQDYDAEYEPLAKKYKLDYELLGQSAANNADDTTTDGQLQELTPREWCLIYSGSLEGLIGDRMYPLDK